MEIFREQDAGHLVMISSMSAMRGHAQVDDDVRRHQGRRRPPRRGPAQRAARHADQGHRALPRLHRLGDERAGRAEDAAMVSTEKGVRAMVDAIEKEKASACVPPLPVGPDVRGDEARPAPGAQGADVTHPRTRAPPGRGARARGARASRPRTRTSPSAGSRDASLDARSSTNGSRSLPQPAVWRRRETPGARAPECPAHGQQLSEQPDQACAVHVEAEGVGAGDVLADVAGEDEHEEHSHGASPTSARRVPGAEGGSAAPSARFHEDRTPRRSPDAAGPPRRRHLAEEAGCRRRGGPCRRRAGWRRAGPASGVVRRRGRRTRSPVSEVGGAR